LRMFYTYLPPPVKPRHDRVQGHCIEKLSVIQWWAVPTYASGVWIFFYRSA
jgi:hypothetical protein